MRRGTRDGFTLIEALVAFAIVAAATVVVHRSLVQSRLAVARAAERETAEWVARDLVAEPLSARDMREGGRTGLLSGHRYEIRLTPLADTTDDETIVTAPGTDTLRNPTEPQVRWLPMRVRISITTGRPDPLEVETIKLGRVFLPGVATLSR